MPYQAEATGDTPAHIIYLIDVSGSMEELMPESQKRKIDVVSDLLTEIAKVMLKRSRRGRMISNRYKVALYAYGNAVIADTNNQFLPVSEFVERIPDFGKLKPEQTNTKSAFERAHELLRDTLPKMDRCPAPLVCHLTDGEYTQSYGDPTPVAKRIMAMKNPDGNVLVQNVYISDKPLLAKPVQDVKQWTGIQSESDLQNSYARTLFSMSSALPETYGKELQRESYSFKVGSPMLFPAESVDMLRLAFMASGSTPRGGAKELP